MNLLSLRNLNLSKNNIKNVREVDYLENLMYLSYLDFSYNPIQERRYYRIQVIYKLLMLQALDGTPLTSEEAVRAEDFYGLREYQPGDAIRHIAWRAYARSETLMTKQFAAYADRRVWLEWDHFEGLDREARLSRLCFWVLRLNSTNDEYGLRLPGLEIAPARGEAHRDEVLKTLALFELDLRG